MSLKQRIKSASLGGPNLKANPKRRYERIQTESSQFIPQYSNKVRSYSRDQQRKGKTVHPNQVIAKQPQQMIEQNLNLKMFINDLQQQLTLQRGRLQMNKKKTQKFVKQLNRQFDKELYYSGKNPHSYMFSGIKQQYENIKHLYQLKCLQVQKYAQSVDNTNIEELNTFIEILQEQNKLLKEKIQQLYQIKQQDSNLFQVKRPNSKPHKHSQVERLYTEFDQNQLDENIYIQSREKVSSLQYKSEQNQIKYYKRKLQACQSELAQSKKKIVFLEKLIIEKGNNEHHAKRQSKKLLNEKNQYQNQIKKLKEKIIQNQDINQKKLQYLFQLQKKRFENQSQLFKKSLVQKNDQITKLQKEVRFLSTMLSYWKPLDQLNRNDFLGIKDVSQRQEQLQPKIKLTDHKKRQSVTSEHQAPSDIIHNLNTQNQHDHSFKSNREEDVMRKNSGVRSQSHQNVANILKERVPQSCSKKTTSTAKKCRKIELHQIKELGQLLRYRLIGHSYSLEQMRLLFDLSQNCPTAQQRQFRSQYISMREVKAILKRNPFSLSETQAILVSRYVVEDEPSQFVYWDQGNQIKRTIAKSIIKTFVGDYILPNISDVNLEWEKLKSNYLHNIQSALNILAPKGMISESKFIELLIGLGIEVKEQFKDWMVAAMVVKSLSLKQLNYRILIPES